MRGVVEDWREVDTVAPRYCSRVLDRNRIIKPGSHVGSITSPIANPHSPLSVKIRKGDAGNAILNTDGKTASAI